MKWLIAPGFLILGVGLLLIRGIQTDSSWTHLIPGLIVAGRRHRPDQPAARLHGGRRGQPGALRHGLGVNSTLPPGRDRHRHRRAGLDLQPAGRRRRPPGLSGKVPGAALDGLTGALSGGQVHAAAEGAQKAASAAGGQSAGQQAFDLVNRVGTSAVVDSLNHITLIAAVIAFAAGVLCLVPDPAEGLRGPRRPAAPPSRGSAAGARSDRRRSTPPATPGGLSRRRQPRRARPCGCSQPSVSGPLGTMPDGFTSLCTT